MVKSSIFRLMAVNEADGYNSIRKSAQSRDKVVKDAVDQYYPELHEINDKAKFPDDEIMYESGLFDEQGMPIMASTYSPVVRIPLAIEKDIINKKAIFAMGSSINLEPNNPDSKLFQRVESDFYDNKMHLIGNDFITDVMASTQAAVIMYSPEIGEEPNPDTFKFKFKMLSPLRGDVLEPFFDEDTGDFIAFGREYQFNDKKRYDFYFINETGFVEIRRYENGKPRVGDVEGERFDALITPYKKLPIIYGEIEQGECADIKILRNEFERAYSGFWEQCKKTGDPLLFGKGTTLSLPNKERAGKYIEGSPDSSLEYLTPQNATESRLLQFNTAEKYMYSLCNSVKFDIDTFKGGGVTSGEALDKLLLPMFLDAKEKQDGVLGMFYQRLINWLVAETGRIVGEEKDLRIDVSFNKLSFSSEDEQIKRAMSANGGLPVVDHLQSIAMAGITSDAVKTLELIKAQGEEETPAD